MLTQADLPLTAAISTEKRECGIATVALFRVRQTTSESQKWLIAKTFFQTALRHVLRVQHQCAAASLASALI